jgi:sulfate/thiosulfate transport system permease protein
MIGARDASEPTEATAVTQDPALVRLALIALVVAVFALLIALPMAVVLAGAFRHGIAGYVQRVTDPLTLSALRLTLLVVGVAVPVNVAFGLAAAWAIGKFDFPGRSALVTLIDLPFAVSPVISGMVFVLLFGGRSALGPWLVAHNIRIVFATPGIILATVFVTFPFVARELIPVFEAQGTTDEEAAVVSGASGWQTFWRVTLPNARWALLSGVALAVARAAGEFGAVSVVSGHIRGRTNTLPLHVEVLYDSYDSTGAFAVASLLVAVALTTLVVRWAIEWREESVAHGGRMRDEAAAQIARAEAA